MKAQSKAILARRKSTSGLSLLEIMIALAIIALVAGLLAPLVLSNFARAKVQTARVEMENIHAGLQLFYVDTGRFPRPRAMRVA